MKNIFIIFIILYLDLIAFTIILPLFPSIIDHYGNANTTDSSLDYIHQVMEWAKLKLDMPERARYNNVLIGGILGSLFSILQFISSPVIGSFSDIFGRKNVLLLSMLGTILSYFLWWKAETFTIFLLSRVIGGLAKGSVTLCTTMMSDITTKENRGKGMAFIGLSFSFGFITGPLIGAYFASQSTNSADNAFMYPAQIALFIQVLDFLLVLFLLDETNLSSKVSSWKSCLFKSFNLINPLNMFKSHSSKNSGTIQRIVLTNFFYLLFFSGLEFTLTFLTHERFQFNSMQQGRLFFFAGIIMMLVQGGYVRRLKNKEKPVAIQGMVAIIPGMLILSVTSTLSMTYAALTLYSFGAGTVVPCLTSLFSQNCAENEVGEKIGVFRSAGALARAIAPVITCTVYWSLGSTVCYFIGALCFVLPLGLLLTIPSAVSVDDKSK